MRPADLLPLVRRLFGFLRSAGPRALVEFRDKDLRWSHFALAAMVVVATGVNLWLPHGWTAWPFVIAAAILMYLHEAADRNGEGIPPGHVYAFFAGGVTVWILATLLLSAINPFVIVLGVGTLLYYVAQAFLKDRAARLLVQSRRAAGQCVFCGELADPAHGICMNCGEEPDPDAMQIARVQAVVRNRGGGNRGQRMKGVLKQDTLAAAAKKKEAALLARSRLRRKKK